MKKKNKQISGKKEKHKSYIFAVQYFGNLINKCIRNFIAKKTWLRNCCIYLIDFSTLSGCEWCYVSRKIIYPLNIIPHDS